MMDGEALLSLGLQSSSTADHQQTLLYFEQLKASEHGWKICMQALTVPENDTSDDQRKFFCLQVVQDYLKTRYSSASVEDQQIVRSFLHELFQRQVNRKVKEKSYVRNKVAQLFSLSFVVDFPRRWSSFFADLLRTLSLGSDAVDIYLRVLSAIDAEVIDREIPHTPQENERNTVLKDAMRLEAVPRLAESWYHIITTYEETCPEVVVSCLSVVGAYISWIDVGLVVNDCFVSVLLRFMSRRGLREAACDCIHDILSKGMDPFAKIKLIESFLVVLDNAGALQVSQEDDDIDFMAKVAKLINTVGLQMIQIWQKLVKGQNAEGSKLALEVLEQKVPLMLSFLGHEDDDVSLALVQFAHDYVTLLKQFPPLNNGRDNNIKNLLYTIVRKMKYDDSYNFVRRGQDEAEFDEYRKQLKVILNNLGALDSNLVLSTAETVFNQTIQQWRTSTYQDVEIAMTLLYMLVEAIPQLNSQSFTGDPSKATALQKMMQTLVASGVSQYGHQAVVLQFFETVVRYERFFNVEPSYIVDVLMAFVDERGMRNVVPHVCSRTAYLFSRFVKDINKSHLQLYAELILGRLEGLLITSCPTDDCPKQYLTSEDKLFIYEAAGVIIIQSQLPPERKYELMRQLLAPLVTRFRLVLERMVTSTEKAEQELHAKCLYQIMTFASRTSKGFTAQQNMNVCGCVSAYTDALRVFLESLRTPVQRQTVHGGVRQFLHRLVVCLNEEILPFIPETFGHLLNDADAKELYDFIPLINQVVFKFKRLIVPYLREVFVPIVRIIFGVLAVPTDEHDQIAAEEKTNLRRGYFTFIATLVNNDVMDVLVGQDAESLKQILLTIISGAMEINDPVTQKSCFAILKRFIDCWGGGDVLPGFKDFMYEHIVPACVLTPLKSTFDIGDAQTVLALNECAVCLKTIADKNGNIFVEYMRSTYLPTLNLMPELIQEFCSALTADGKVFKAYYKTFIRRLKS